MEKNGPVARPAWLVLIRHGESQRNEAKKGATYFADEDARRRIKGVPDHKIELTERGWEQARQTGRALRERFGTPHYFYHSGYARTEQTMEGILEAYSTEERGRIQTRLNQNIRERDSGYTYDMTTPEAEAAFPYLSEYWATFGGYFARPPGGQSLADKTHEVHAFLDTIFRDRSGDTVFVSTHGGPIRCFRFLLERWGYEQATKWPPGQSPKNCGVTVYRFDQDLGRLVLVDYNTVYHDLGNIEG